MPEAPRKVFATIPVNTEGLDLQLPVRRGRRKTLALVVGDDGEIECRVPLRCPWREIESFVFANVGWIKKTQTVVAGQVRRPKPRFEAGAVHYFLGRPYRLELVNGGRGRIKLINETLQLTSSAGTPDQIKGYLERWYRREADRIFADRQCNLINRHQIRAPVQLKVRKMRAKWGSCSQSGLITLNLWLVTQDIRAIDYVILHELCHLKHFNHTPGYYAYLADLMPDWEHRRALLI